MPRRPRRNNAPRYDEVIGNQSTATSSSGTGATVASPPAYIHTVYDETHRGIWYPQLKLMSMAQVVHLLGYLEFHAPISDGSFGICVAGGIGSYVSKALLESIPEEHRPVLNEEDAGREVESLFQPMTTLGSVMFPFILTNAQTGERMRYVIRTYVLPRLLIPMFISGPDNTGVVEGVTMGGRADRKSVFLLKCRDTVCEVLGTPFPS